MNRIFLIGNLVADPEYQVTASGVPMCRFRIAVNRRFSSNNQSEDQRDVDFFRITTFRKTAEHCGSYLAKGRKVGIVGSVQINDYTDKEGNKRQSFDITADEVEFLTPKGESGEYSSAAPKKTSTLEPVSDDTLPF